MTKSINPDQRLIDGIAAGDPKILNEIYTNYSKAILHLVETNNGNADDAQDVFQEGMMVLFRKARAADFQLTSNFLTYFYSVCRHIWWKKRDKKGRTTSDLDAVQETADDASIEQDIFRKERYTLYLQKLKQLSEGCQKVLTC